MPFVSDKQRKFLFKKKLSVAAKLAKKHGSKPKSHRNLRQKDLRARASA